MQSHLVIDFPFEKPINAKALAEELPPLMPDFARVQDGLGTVHFSRFMVEGDEKLLFLSDIDGEVDQHIQRLVESAGPVFDAIFTHVDDPPATPVAGNSQKVIKWLKHHCHDPLDTYSAYEDASVQDIQACARAAGFEGNTLQSPLLIYMSIKSRMHAFALNLVKARVGKKGHEEMESVGTVHFMNFVPFENKFLGFFTIYDGDFRSTPRTSQIRPRSSSILSFHTSMARRLPRSRRTPRRSINGRWRATRRPSGSTAPIQASRSKTSEPC